MKARLKLVIPKTVVCAIKPFSIWMLVVVVSACGPELSPNGVNLNPDDAASSVETVRHVGELPEALGQSINANIVIDAIFQDCARRLGPGSKAFTEIQGNKNLRSALQNSPSEAISMCECMLEQDVGHRMGAEITALKVNAYSSLDLETEAVNTAFGAWSEFGRHYDQMSERYILSGVFEQAGFELESWLVASAPGDTSKLASELQYWRNIPNLQGENENSILRQLYSQQPLDAVSAWKAQGLPIGNDPALDAVNIARLLANAIRTTDFESALLLSAKFEDAVQLYCLALESGDAVHPLLEAAGALIQQSSTLHAVAPQALDSSKKLNDAQSNLGKNLRSAHMILTKTFLRVDTKLAIEEYEELVNGWASSLVESEDFAAAVDLYETLANRFPAEQRSASYLEKIADIYENDLSQWDKASNFRLELIEKFPNSESAVQAILRLASMRVQAGQIDDAYNMLSESFEGDLPSVYEAYAPHGQFLLAQCESRLGLKYERDERVTRFVEDFSDSSVAPVALLWLGKEKIDDRLYVEADKILERIRAEYGSTEASVTAATYLAAIREYVKRDTKSSSAPVPQQ